MDFGRPSFLYQVINNWHRLSHPRAKCRVRGYLMAPSMPFDVLHFMQKVTVNLVQNIAARHRTMIFLGLVNAGYRPYQPGPPQKGKSFLPDTNAAQKAFHYGFTRV